MEECLPIYNIYQVNFSALVSYSVVTIAVLHIRALSWLSQRAYSSIAGIIP